MNILYGIQTTGNGHLTRSKLLIKQLKDSGHQVQVILSGRSKEKLWDVEELIPYKVFPGLTYVQYKGKVHYWQTLKQLRLIRLVSDIINYNSGEFDIVISDFDPVSAYIAKINSIPSIGIGHQYAFNYDIPKAGANPISTLIMKIFAPVDFKVGLHWSNFGQPILPPIIPNFGLVGKTENNKILVYLPYEDQDLLLNLFTEFNSYRFCIYTDKLLSGIYKNTSIKSFSKINFQGDLKSCNGVICNAGFELPSEALSLGKKLLVKPIEKQMEQISNAKAIEMLNLGSVTNKFNKKNVEQWLKTKESKTMVYNNVVDALSLWITSKNWNENSIHNLSKRLWN